MVTGSRDHLSVSETEVIIGVCMMDSLRSKVESKRSMAIYNQCPPLIRSEQRHTPSGRGEGLKVALCTLNRATIAII